MSVEFGRGIGNESPVYYTKSVELPVFNRLLVSENNSEIIEIDKRVNTFVGELTQREQQRQKDFPPFLTSLGVTYRNGELGTVVDHNDRTAEGLEKTMDYLDNKGALTLHKRYGLSVPVSGENVDIVAIGATETKVNGDMSSKYWTRDMALVGKANFELWMLDNTKYAEEGNDARKLLTSTMHLMSTDAQLDRFRGIIASDDPAFKKNFLNWPQIAIEESKLDSREPTEWRHNQDAWQMLGITVLDALEQNLLDVGKLKDGNKEFLASMAPFLQAIDFTNAENSGSWEENAVAGRTSVVAVETALLYKLRQLADNPQFAFLRGEKDQESYKYMLDHLLDQGLQKLADNIPFEAPHGEGFAYRSADATLVYLLDYGIPQLLAERQIPMKINNEEPMEVEAIEDKILEQLKSLHDPVTHGKRRYGANGDLMVDSYLGINYNTDEVKQDVDMVKTIVKQEANGGPIDTTRKAELRQKIVPQGSPAAWTHPNAQVSSWAANRYLETGKERYHDISKKYMDYALAGITSEGEYHALWNGTQHEIVPVAPYRIPEALTTIRTESGIASQIASPHVPLNWGVGEYKRMLGLAIAAARKEEMTTI